jgi:hypothetical protein
LPFEDHSPAGFADVAATPRVVDVVWIFATPVAFLAFCSISFDFHDCPNPSRDLPYLFAGRQALGALIPFMLLFVSGLDNLLERLYAGTKFIVLGGLLVLVLAVEAAADRAIFADAYNWFHM